MMILCRSGSFPRVLSLVFSGIATLVFVHSAQALQDDTWQPPATHCFYIRNNSNTDMEVRIKQDIPGSIRANQVFNDNRFGNPITVLPKGETTPALIIPEACRNTNFKCYMEIGFGNTRMDFKLYGDMTADSPLPNAHASYEKYKTCGYLTIGEDPFSEMGPTASNDELDVQSLTVSSYNVFLGTAAKPRLKERGDQLRYSLAAMDTDVLCLQEMNLRETGIVDGPEIAAYLWYGATGPNAEDYLYENSYNGRDDDDNNGDNGRGTSPFKEGGAFPFMSQFTSGLPVAGNESSTGGGVIFSKYPLEMIRNKTFNDLANEVGFEEQKGYLIVKVTKTIPLIETEQDFERFQNDPDSFERQEYYILNTHTQKSTDWELRDNQIREIKRYIRSHLPEDARVIVAGDWNSDLVTTNSSGFGGFEAYHYGNGVSADNRQARVTYWNRVSQRAKYANWWDNTSRVREMDFDGDGMDDICIGPKINTGEWYILQHDWETGQLVDLDSVVSEAVGRKYTEWWNNTDRIRVMDFNGDGKDDICIGPKSSGEWYVLQSNGTSFDDLGEVANAYDEWWDNTDRIRVMDFNGDGKDDICIGPKKATGEWYILESDGTSFVDQGPVVANAYAEWWNNTDRIRVMDFNGDEMDDICIGPRSSGEWYILESDGTSFVDQGPVVANAYAEWWNNTDRIRVMDFNNDGKDDVCIGPKSSGEWYILQSDGTSFDDLEDVANAYGEWWNNTDRIRLMDFNGDGMDDVCIGPKRDSGEWFIMQSNGTVFENMGAVAEFESYLDYTGLPVFGGAVVPTPLAPRIRVLANTAMDGSPMPDAICIGPRFDGIWHLLESDGSGFLTRAEMRVGDEGSGKQGSQIDWVLFSDLYRYEQPTNVTAGAFPVRSLDFRLVELSDHIGVWATFSYNK